MCVVGGGGVKTLTLEGDIKSVLKGHCLQLAKQKVGFFKVNVMERMSSQIPSYKILS